MEHRLCASCVSNGTRAMPSQNECETLNDGNSSINHHQPQPGSGESDCSRDEALRATRALTKFNNCVTSAISLEMSVTVDDKTPLKKKQVEYFGMLERAV